MVAHHSLYRLHVPLYRAVETGAYFLSLAGDCDDETCRPNGECFSQRRKNNTHISSGASVGCTIHDTSITVIIIIIITVTIIIITTTITNIIIVVVILSSPEPPSSFSCRLLSTLHRFLSLLFINNFHRWSILFFFVSLSLFQCFYYP